MKKNYSPTTKHLIHTIHFKTVFICILSFLFLVAPSLTAQETVVVGQVLNSSDKSPIPNVNITFKNSLTVAQSNEEGYFMIRNTGKQNTLIFTSVGYKKHEIRIKPGQSVGLQVDLEEENTLLQEVFIVPGSNPAIEMMKKVRLLVRENDISRQTGYKTMSTEQNLVLLSKVNQRSMSKRIFDQLKIGSVSGSDSSMVIPLYMDEKKYRITSTDKKELSDKLFSSPVAAEKILEKLVGELDTELNFYNNSVSVYGKSMVSPLASVGNAFYDYYLADSLKTPNGKQYEIHFRSRNTKNLAFDGKLLIDSVTFGLTSIEANLPAMANINFIHNLRISQKFIPVTAHHWMRQNEELELNMDFALLTDSLHPRPEIFVKRSAVYHTTDSDIPQSSQFAQSGYNQTTLDEKLNELNNTPLLRTAKWVASTVITGSIPVGVIDIGKIEQIIRSTNIEGIRLALPFHTNEKLWKDVSLGGMLGYGFKNETFKYSGSAQYKFHDDNHRILGFSYTDDYRRIDYNYNDYMYRENPLVTGDEDFSGSFSALTSAGKMSLRKEYSLSLSNDWNPDIESNVYLRSNQLFANPDMPMNVGGVSVAGYLLQQSATLSTRFSFDERTYDDHMQRIYVSNYKPVVYGILEAGRYQFGNKTGQYGKIMGAIRQFIRFDFGQFNYKADAGIILGNVPYPLLGVPPGNESGGYSFYLFNMMDYMEYASDKYINLHTELTLNGLIMNQIPLIKLLNLREMFTMKMAYGGLSDSHREQLDYPSFMYSFKKPYMEVGAGLTNILHIFTLQAVWRLTDIHHEKENPWGILGCLTISF
jgi:hypothetical protein